MVPETLAVNTEHVMPSDPAISTSSPTMNGNNDVYTQQVSLSSPVSHESKVSVQSTRSHQEYLDSLIPPTPKTISRIKIVQEQKELETLRKRWSREPVELLEEQRARAAQLIQRNYRGHRERRMLNGMSLDPSERWIEAIKEARYRHITQPRARESTDGVPVCLDETIDSRSDSTKRHSAALQNWKKIGMIAKRAGWDEDEDDVSRSDEDEDIPEYERDERRRKVMEKKAERQKAAKMMDLQYWLEAVDLKHRYGTNLKVYHQQWKASDTNENFFYWLDFGEGRYIDCEGCPRERLDREQVRYLSKEERMDYLVKIDKEGRLCWAKNGAYIDTTEKYKDSIHGIVPDTDDTPAYVPVTAEAANGLQDDEESDSSYDSDDGHHHHGHHHNEADEEAARANRYATPGFDKSRGMKKVKHVSASTIFDKILRGSVKKNTWIFVADTSFRLYVGIKQSGAFQHSSFLHGSRISAAGLIKVKNGRLGKLSPLSGHYRPPGMFPKLANKEFNR
jgi:hypothetical protein